jgi:hypothetical protein
MTLQATRAAPEGERPPSVNPDPIKKSDAPSLPGYVVLMITKYGTPRRKVYLDLGHARKAVERTQAQGRQAWLVLCQLRPVSADLDIDGEA